MAVFSGESFRIVAQIVLNTVAEDKLAISVLVATVIRLAILKADEVGDDVLVLFELVTEAFGCH